MQYKVTGITWDMPTTITVDIADNIKDWTEIGNEIEKSLKANFGVKPINFTYVIDGGEAHWVKQKRSTGEFSPLEPVAMRTVKK